MDSLLHKIAVAAGATEAAAFEVEGWPPELSLRLHLRPDAAPQAVRDAAIAVLSDVASQCVMAAKDGCVRVTDGTDPAPGVDPQFCLVHLLCHRGVSQAALAMIVRCRDEDEAMKRLKFLAKIA